MSTRYNTLAHIRHCTACERLYCAPRALPLLFLGYSLGGACYAVGRVLTVRGHAWPGHMVHCGVHVFANLGNLLILPYVIV